MKLLFLLHRYAPVAMCGGGAAFAAWMDDPLGFAACSVVLGIVWSEM